MPKQEKEQSNRRETEVILDSIADGVFTVDGDWNITSFNKAAEKITGVSRKQAVGQKCFDVFHANICQTACVLRETLKANKEIIARPVNIIRSDGKNIPISISTAVLRNEKGKIIGGVETFRDLSTIEELRKEITAKYTFEDIISKNHEIRKIFDILPDIAVSDSTVLVEGPSGSGKELFARAIHNLSNRKNKPFIPVNCGALPDTLLESELFGYLKGAFTDAKKDKPGRFALAQNGTILLDEIGDVSPAMQVKLLRVIEEKEYEPLGATKPIKANVRIIATTNKTLYELVKKGSFREDLYYRLNVIRIYLPPLNQRREDIPLLVDHFLKVLSLSKGKKIERVSPEVLEILMKHDFPGNIRELENILEHAFVLCRGNQIETRCLPNELVNRYQEGSEAISHETPDKLEQAEAKAIIEVLKCHNGNRGLTAQELGIDKTTLWRKIKKYGIT
jgi:PAS domain S-box-containing protein